MISAPISTNAAVQNPNTVKPQKQTTNAAAQKATAKPKTDTVTISKQAVLRNSPDYTPAEEARETTADKNYEKIRGQR